MRKFFLFIILMCTIEMAYAQDIIVTKDGSLIEAKVTEIGDTNIKYKKWSNQNGPIYTLNINQVFSIKYQNGEKEVFNKQSSTSKSPQTNHAKTQNKSQIIQSDNDVIDIQGSQSQNPRKNFNVQNNYSQDNNLVNQLQNMNYEMEKERLMRKGKNIQNAGMWVGTLGIVGGILISSLTDYNALGWTVFGSSMATGVICAVVGGNKIRAAKSMNLKMDMNNIQIIGLYEHNKTLKNKSNLSTGLAVLNDKQFSNKALGMNIKIRF